MRRLASLIGAAALVFSMAVPAMASRAGPVAADDGFVVDNKVAHLDVLANDTFPGGTIDTSTLRIASGPTYGEAVVIASGSPKVKYTASGPEAAIDTFRYEICDTDGACATAIVTVNISGDPVVTPTTATTTTTTIVSIIVPPPIPVTTTAAPAPTTTTPAPTTAVPAPPIAVVEVELPTSTVTAIATVTTGTPTVTTAGLEVSTVTTSSMPKVHALGELTLGSNGGSPAATTIGEARRGLVIGEDFAYLGRSGLDTLALVATPALMVSGVIGFLMIGLPHNAFGTALGYLVGRRRKRTDGLPILPR